MSQQYPFGNANEKYKLKLFVDTGMNYMEVGARVIKPYEPPRPNSNVKEIKLINAPSHFHQMGISSYKAKVTLLFNDKVSYNEYLALVGFTHKFYDEKGNIYLGTVEEVVPKVHEANSRYTAELDLTLVKKDSYDKKDRFDFQDIDGHWYEDDVKEMSNLGLITVITRDGNPVVYFRGADYCTRAEFIVFLNRTRRLLEKIIRE